MSRFFVGILIGLFIGAGCRWLDVPLPAPPKLIGALLVVAMTLGYMGADRILTLNPRPVQPTTLTPDHPTQDVARTP